MDRKISSCKQWKQADVGIALRGFRVQLRKGMRISRSRLMDLDLDGTPLRENSLELVVVCVVASEIAHLAPPIQDA
jgi:hypothetical protein